MSKSSNKNYLIVILSLLIFVGCKSNASGVNQPISNEQKTETKAPSQDSNLKAAEILEAFKNANLPISEETIFTEENDPNKLLNRPNQYTEKVSWKDKRMDVIGSEKTNATLEVFKTQEDLENRKKYVESMNKVASALAQYSYAHKNALLRLNHQLTPKQAEEYEKILKGL